MRPRSSRQTAYEYTSAVSGSRSEVVLSGKPNLLYFEDLVEVHAFWG